MQVSTILIIFDTYFELLTQIRRTNCEHLLAEADTQTPCPLRWRRQVKTSCGQLQWMFSWSRLVMLHLDVQFHICTSSSDHVRSATFCNISECDRMRWCDTDSLHSSASVEISGGLEEQDLPHVVQSRGINIPVGLRADGAGRVDSIIMTWLDCRTWMNLVHLVPGQLRDQVSQTGSPAKPWKLSNAPSTSTPSRSSSWAKKMGATSAKSMSDHWKMAVMDCNSLYYCNLLHIIALVVRHKGFAPDAMQHFHVCSSWHLARASIPSWW